MATRGDKRRMVGAFERTILGVVLGVITFNIVNGGTFGSGITNQVAIYIPVVMLVGVMITSALFE